MKKSIILLLIVLMLTFSTVNGVSVEDANFKIESSKETYYCQNIISNDGCLIKADVTITKLTPGNKLVDLYLDSNQDITIRNHEDKRRGLSIATDKGKGRNIASSGQTLISDSNPITLDLYFYASETGKFNYSIKYDGNTWLVLDPIFNTSFNVTTPSLHLINGSNNNVSDNDYLTQNDITTGLSDGSDLTTFSTFNTLNATAYYRFNEGSGSNATDGSGNRRHGVITGATYVSSLGSRNTGSTALDFDGISDKIVVSDSVGNFNFGDATTDRPFSVGAWINMDDENSFRIASKWDDNAPNLEWFFGSGGNLRVVLQLFDNDLTERLGRATDVLTPNINSWLHVVATYDGSGNNAGIDIYINGTIADTTDVSLGSYTAMHNTSIDLTIGHINNGATTADGTIDEVFIIPSELTQSEVIEIFNNGLNHSGNAIKPFFNITLDSSNEYFLRTRKTTTGVDEVTVYLYENGSDVNLTLVDVHTVTTGWDIIPLPVSVRNGSNATFRFFTDRYAEFSEVQLIEGVNDSVNPSVIDESVNNTGLDCENGNTIRFSANVTDNNFIDTVFFGFDDLDGKNFVEADRIIDTDVFFIDKVYSATTAGNETYNFTNVSATDIAGNVNNSFNVLPYNYSCVIDVVNPIVTLNSPSDDTLDNLTVHDFVCSATDNGVLSNITLFHNVSGAFVAVSVVNVSGSSSSVNFSGVSTPFNGSYVWNCLVVDGSGNSAFASSNFSLTVNQTFPQLQIISISPEDGASFREIAFPFLTISFSFNSSFAGVNASLYINGSLNQSVNTSIGVNSFSGVSFNVNGTFEWVVNGSFNAENVISDFRLFNVSIILGESQFFSIRECKTGTGESIILVLIVGISLFFILIALMFNIGVFGFFGSIMLMVVSWFIAPCFNFFALVLGLFSFFLIIWFVISGLGFRNTTFKDSGWK